MIDFKTHRLLNEVFGFASLGVRPAQSLGITGAVNEGLPPEVLAKLKNKGSEPSKLGLDDMGPEDHMEPDGDEHLDGEEGDMDGDEFGHDEEGEEGHDHDEFGDDEDGDEHDHDDMDGEEGDEEDHEHDDMDADLDHDDDMGMAHDVDAVPGDNVEIPALPPKKSLRPAKAFMNKEHCGDEDDHEEGEEGGDKPVFMMKKGMKKGMCKGCKKCSKMKVEGYGRPKDYDPSPEAWEKSVREQAGAISTSEKFFDGMKKEDVLLAPPVENVPSTPAPGEPGYAPQTRIGDWSADPANEILKRMEQLGK